MSTLSIEDMKQRILKPTRTSLNAKANAPPQASTPSTEMDGPRGQAHRPMESGAMAYHPPSAYRQAGAAQIPSPSTFHGGVTSLRIPKPSELFGIQHGFGRTPAHPAVQPVPHASVLSTVPQLPTQGQLSAASVTRQREHDRRLRSLSVKMQRANLKRRLAASLGGGDSGDPPHDPSDLWATTLHSAPPSSSSSILGGVFTGLRHWATDRLSGYQSVSPETDAGVHMEFDTDIVDALVYTVGRWMGLDTEQLRDSPGLRTLVSRNIQWFRASPDWMKLLGLVMAKKLNHSLDCPRRVTSSSDTQRMLLDRLIQADVVAKTEPEVSAPEADVTMREPEEVTAPQPPVKRSKTSKMSSPQKSKKTTKAAVKEPKTKKKATTFSVKRMTTTEKASKAPRASKKRRVHSSSSFSDPSATVHLPEGVFFDTNPMVAAETVSDPPTTANPLSVPTTELPLEETLPATTPVFSFGTGSNASPSRDWASE